MQRRVRIAVKTLGQQFADRRRDVTPALEHGAHGRLELVRFAFLVQVTVRAHLEQVQRILLRRITRQDQHRQIGLALADGPQDIDAALIRHGDIEQQHVANLAARDIQRLTARSAFGHDFKVARRRKNLLETCSYYLVIVTNGNAYHCLPLNFPCAGKCRICSARLMRVIQHRASDILTLRGLPSTAVRMHE